MSRRVSRLGLILVFAIWSAVLLSPTLRVLLRAQAAPEWPILLQKIGVKEEGFARVLREHPDDLRVLAQQIESVREPEKAGEDYRKGILRRYDELIEKFPNEEWLLQNRLRLSMSGDFDMDGGEFSRPEYGDEKRAPWLSREEMLQTLKVAERGAQLDSQNSFYDWTRAICLFGLKRDEDALRAFHDGARKTHFDDGIYRDSQNKVAVRSMQSPLLWEDRMIIVSFTLVPHLAIMRRANRAAIWRGVLAQRKGDHQRALRIYGDQMKMAQLMRRDSTLLIGTLVGESLEVGAWERPTIEPNPAQKLQQTFDSTRGEAQSKNKDNATRFARYARRHGREDLAVAALNDVGQINFLRSQHRGEKEVFAVSEDALRSMFRLHWASAILLRAIALSTLGWLLLSAVLLSVRRLTDLTRVSALDISSAALFAVAACIVAFVATLRLNPNWMDFVRWPEFNMLIGSEENSTNTTSKFSIWMPLILTFLYCNVVMLWRGRKSTLRISSNEIPHNSSVRKSERIVIWLTFAVAMFVFWWQWLIWLGAQNFIDGVTFPGLFLPIPIGWICYRTLKKLPARRLIQSIIYDFAWSRSTLGVLVVIGSTAYFICALFALPLRKQADARMDEYLAKGEMVLIREAAEK